MSQFNQVKVEIVLRVKNYEVDNLAKMPSSMQLSWLILL